MVKGIPQWEFVKEIQVTKVLQDDPIKEVFWDKIETYYGTTRKPRLGLPLSHELVMERLKGFLHRIRYKWANEFTYPNWFEIKELTWNDTPLFTESPVDETAL